MSAPIVGRLCRLAGVAPPTGALARALVRCPRPRLVRAIAWLASAPTMQLGGVRLVVRGWDDVYTALQVPRDAARADIERPIAGAALVIRSARIGRGWQKEPLPSLGAVRAETKLAVTWLAAAAGCILHEDCVAFPELGAACFAASLSAVADSTPPRARFSS